MLFTTNWELRRRWHRQIGAKKLLPSHHLRHAAGVGFLCQGWRPQGFVELSRLIVVAVYDLRTADGDSKIRVAGYRPQVTSERVDWIGGTKAVFWKDLLLRPKAFSKGQRLDLRGSALLQLALRLEHRIQQAERHPRRIEKNTLQFPRLWAGFSRSISNSIEPNGPELEALCSKFGLTREAMSAKFKQELDGLVLLPATWIVEDLHRATTTFAELAGIPSRQAARSAVLRKGITTDLAGEVSAHATTN